MFVSIRTLIRETPIDGSINLNGKSFKTGVETFSIDGMRHWIAKDIAEITVSSEEPEAVKRFCDACLAFSNAVLVRGETIWTPVGNINPMLSLGYFGRVGQPHNTMTYSPSAA